MSQFEQKEEGDNLFSVFPPVSTSEWEAMIHADLKGADYDRKLIWRTIEGFDVKPYYRMEDIADLPQILSLPAEYPFVRGNKKPDNSWEIRQDIRQNDFKKANTLAKRALSHGADAVGLNVKDVVSIDDLKLLLDGIDITKIRLHFQGSMSYSIFINILIGYLKTHSIKKTDVHGSFNYDHYAYYLLHGEYYNSLSDNLNELKCLIELVQKEIPNLDVINVNGQLFHNAGANVVQELACSLAVGVEYLASLTEMGMKPADILPRMRFTLALGGNYFFDIAKIRAFRMLWASLAKEYVPNHPELQTVFIHAETSIWNKTIYDPYVNMLRNTTEAMAGAIAGVDSLCVHPFDIAYHNDDEFSQRIARNTQIVIKEESYLDKVVDPAAGSYYIERITAAIATHALELLNRIEQAGGFVHYMESGALKDDIEQTALRRDMDIAMRKTSILGTNQYPNLQETMLEKIEYSSRWPDQYLKIYRGAEVFEELRLDTEKYVARGHNAPHVFLLTIGNQAMRKARATFVTGVFGCAGYLITDNAGFETAAAGVEAALTAGANIVVICSSDEDYAELGPAIAQTIKQRNASVKVFVAGNPTDSIEMLKASGVDDFVHLRTPVVSFLKDCHKSFGISK